MKPSGVLFDLDDTLLDFTASEKVSFFGSLELLGLSLPHSLRDKFFFHFQTLNQSLWNQFQNGEINKDFLRVERFRKLFEHYQISVDPLIMAETYVELLSKSAIEVPGAHEVCRSLKTAGIALGLVTNGISKVQKSRLKISGLEGYFNAVSVSEEVGQPKPHPQIFWDSLNKLNLTPDQVIVVGDRPDADIVGAKNIGSKSILFIHKKTFAESQAPYKNPILEESKPDFQIRNLLDILKIIKL